MNKVPENIKYAITIILSSIFIITIFKLKKHFDLNSIQSTISTSQKSSFIQNDNFNHKHQSRMVASVFESEPNKNSNGVENNDLDQEKSINNDPLNSIETNHSYLNKYIRGFQQAQVNYYRAQKVFGKGDFQDAINSYIALGDLYADPNVIAPALQEILKKLNENPELVMQLIEKHSFSTLQDSFIELQLINLVMNIDLQSQFKLNFLSEVISRNTSLIDESESSVNFLPAIIVLKNSNIENAKVQKLFDQGLNQLQDEQSKVIYRQAFIKYFPEIEF